MKNKFLLLIALLFSWMSEGVAAVVPANVAAETAKVLLSRRGGSAFKGGEARVETVLRGDNPVYYIVRFDKGGWAMISAEDTTDPLLGYSLESSMTSVNDLPEVIKDWFDEYADEIEYARGLSTLERHYRWDNDIVTRAAADRIDPLIKVNWDQGPPYNASCPGTGSNKAVVGCVAVGMAQALSVVRFPQRGRGTKTYTENDYGQLSVNFDEEPDYDWNAIMSGANNSKEVARLLYHCGVLVNMDYSPSASGTQTDYAAAAFRDYYGFPDHCKFIARSQYSEDKWKSAMIAELQRGRAVIYAGTNTEIGHCFNLDGYDGENMFHINWGWSGMANGYFLLNALDPESQGIGGSNSGYNLNQRAVVGVAPLAEAPYDIKLSRTLMGEGWPAGTYVADVIVYSDMADAEYDFELKGAINSLGVQSAAKYEVREGNRLYTTAEIKNTVAYKTLVIKAINKSSGNSFEKEFALQVQAGLAPPSVGINEILAQEFKLYPVPATDVLHLESPYESGKYAIFNVAGVLLQSGELTEAHSVLDISSLSKGSYMLRYSAEQGVVMKSFIVK